MVVLVAITALGWMCLGYGLVAQRRTALAECSPKFVVSWAARRLGGLAIPCIPWDRQINNSDRL
jgi:hypothetical protein